MFSNQNNTLTCQQSPLFYQQLTTFETAFTTLLIFASSFDEK